MNPKIEKEVNRRLPAANAAGNSRHKFGKLRLGIAMGFALLGLCCGLSPSASAQNTANAITMLDGYNNTFLTWSGNTAYYNHGIDDSGSEGGWGLAIEIGAAEDAYETSGNSSDQALVNDLLNGLLAGTPTNSYAGDGWNDDIGWQAIALIRGYQMTGNTTFLNAAEYGFNMAFARGWDTTSNGGGILELQGTPGKNPLADDSLGQAAAMIYLSTGNTTYLNASEKIYSWVWHNLFNPSTGNVYGYINPDGTVGNGTGNAYNEGTFAEFANYLYEAGAGGSYLNDAISAINYTTNNLSTDIDTTPYTYMVLNNTQPSQQDWADQISRAMGHVCGYTPSLWSSYYGFMTNNCAHIWNNRLATYNGTLYNITWNGWAQPTPFWVPNPGTNADPMVYCGAVAMELFTPGAPPLTSVAGTHTIFNKYSALCLDNPGDSTTWGTDLDQWVYGGGANDNWTFTQNSDGTYTIINEGSGLALDDPDASTAMGSKVDEYNPNGTAAQKWIVTPIQDGCYKLKNEASGLYLDNTGSSTADGTLLDQWSWNGGPNQEWWIKNQPIDPRAGPHTIVNEANGLAIDNGSTDTEGAGVIQWKPNGGPAQRWTFTLNGDGSWTILNQYSGDVLDDPGSSTTSGEQMDQWPADGGANQKWDVEANSDGSYTIWNEASNNVLDDDSLNANGTPLIQWPSTGGTNQKWYLQ
jgi:hypothetical protein